MRRRRRAATVVTTDGSRRARRFELFVTTPESFGPSQTRVLRLASRVRLGVALAFLLVVPVLPGPSAWSKIVVVLAVSGYVATSWYVEERAAGTSWISARVVNPLLGIALLASCSIAIPEVYAAGLFLYLLGAAYFTLIGGLGLGLWIAAASIPLATGSNYLWIPSDHRVSAAVLASFALTLLASVVFCDLVTRERRRASVGIDRLHEAIRSVAPSPNLSETLASITGVITDAVGAAYSGVLLREQDHMVVASPILGEEWTPSWSHEDIERYTRRELASGDSTPLAAAMRHHELVYIPDTRHDARFPRWSDDFRGIFREERIESMALVPLRLAPEVIGVLTVCFSSPGALDRDELRLLEAFADQVTTVIARAQAYEQQHEAARRLEEADRLKSEFLAMVSHELRTPLTAAKGFVDTVLRRWDGLPDERRHRLLELASENSDELARLVDQLLDFSRMEADHVGVRPESHDLGVLVDGVIGQATPVLARHRVEVTVPERLVVRADPDAFGQVLLNLLTNAVKFSPDDSTIVTSARAVGGEAAICVRDEGVGVPPEDQERIFERFYQAAPGHGSRRGMGIGLAIARRFVEMQGGRIWVESTPGDGATFSFTLPLVSVDATDDRSTGQERRATPIAGAQERAP